MIGLGSDKNGTMKCISTSTLQKATSIHLLIAENSKFLRGNTSCGESESVEMDQMQIFPHRPVSIFPHRPASMSPWSTSTLVSKQCNRYYKKIIMMSQIQFCSTKYHKTHKSKTSGPPMIQKIFQTQALLALDRDQQLADKNYSYLDVLKCFKVR